MNSSATSCQRESPGSLFWMCHQSIVTGSPDAGASDAAGSEPGADEAAGASGASDAALVVIVAAGRGDECDDADQQRRCG